MRVRPLFFAVDDESSAQRWYTRILGAYGDVLLAPSAASARQQLSKRPAVSAALFDICLPDGSGLDLLEEFRRVYPTTPAVVVTGQVDAKVVNAAFDLDAGIMAKPFNRDRMHHWVERAINCPPRAADAPLAHALAERVAALKVLLARRPCDARVRYSIGEIIRQLRTEPDRYGAGAVATAAAAVGEALPSLYRHARVAQRWTAREFDGLLARTMADGGSFCWSHFVSLASVSCSELHEVRTMADGGSFCWSHFVSLASVSCSELHDCLVEQALAQSWTVKQLDAALEEAGIDAPLATRGKSE